MKRTLVALNPPRRMHDFLVYAKVIAERLTEDPVFNPPPSFLPDLKADIAALEAALVSATTREIGLAAARRACEAKVMAEIRQVQSYVQWLAGSTSSPDEAAGIAVRAGLRVKNTAGPSKATFAVKPGRTPGSARAYARAAKTRASYEWQYSSDGVHWLSVPTTVRADAHIEGLVAGAQYWFRCRSVTKDGVSDWSEVVVCRAA